MTAGPRSARLLCCLGVVVVVACLPVVLPVENLVIVSAAGIYVLFALGLSAIFSYLGYASFSFNAFAATAAYAVTIVGTHLSAPIWLLAAAAVAATVVVAALFGPLLFRVNGVYFAMATLLLALMVDPVAGSVLQRWTAGYNGLAAPTITLGPLMLSDSTTFYYVVWAVAGAVVVLLVNLEGSSIVRAARAIKANEADARLTGIRPFRVKMILFILSSGVSAIAGVLLVESSGYISPDTFNIDFGLLIFLAVIIGGRRGWAGAFVGGLFIFAVNEVLLMSGTLATTLVFGLLMIVILVGLPDGLVGLGQLLAGWARPAKQRRPIVTLSSGALPSSASLGARFVGREERDGAHDLLVVRDVVVRFGGVTAVDHVTFEVGPGRILAILGPNGAGKTTVLNAVCGYAQIAAGSIAIGDRSLVGKSVDEVRRLGVSRTMQTPWIYGDLSVWENVALGMDFEHPLAPGAAALGMPRSRRSERTVRERAEQLVDLVGLGEVARRPGKELSHGQRRLVTVARAIAGSSRIVLLDEPMAGLSPAMADRTAELIAQIAHWRYGVVLIEHNLEYVSAIATEAAFMHQGRISKRGSVSQLLTDEEVVDQFVGTAPR